MELMSIMKPITEENLSELKPGEWIWDNMLTAKNAHKRTLKYEKITEPVGFRQVHILDITGFRKATDKPFMLSDHTQGGNKWVHFEEGRFFKFKKGMEK